MNYTPQEVADLLKDKPHQPHYIAAMVQKAVQQALAQQDKEIEALKAEAIRYRWLRDNGHLNKWWSSAGPSDRCENIDADIDAAMTGQ